MPDGREDLFPNLATMSVKVNFELVLGFHLDGELSYNLTDYTSPINLQ